VETDLRRQGLEAGEENAAEHKRGVAIGNCEIVDRLQSLNESSIESCSRECLPRTLVAVLFLHPWLWPAAVPTYFHEAYPLNILMMRD
jgi:hypothetical protein